MTEGSTPGDTRAWLEGQPPLAELRERYPAEWDTVKREVRGIVARGDVEELKERVLAVSRPAPAPARAERRRRGGDAWVRTEVRRQMTAAALKQVSLSAATGVQSGKVRFSLLNGWLAQRIFFKRDLERKPVSLARYRLLWPLVRQKQLLMPLVQPKGIYCFYTGKLIRELAQLIGDKSAVEIAAGDGTLSRFLRGAGADVVATDDHSWEHTVTFPEDVAREDAKESLTRRRPQVVLCSWPPPGNTFEREVFKTRSVELYVVISSRHEFGAGDWTAYREQTAFDFAEDPDLSRLVLPPELESAVYVFRRRATLATPDA